MEKKIGYDKNAILSPKRGEQDGGQGVNTCSIE